MESQSLKELEKKAFLTNFEDGLWDIFFGFLLLSNAAVPVLKVLQLPREFAYFFFVASLLVVIFGRKYITIPRLGLIKYGTARRGRQKVLLVLIIVFLVVSCLLWLIVTQEKNSLPAALKIGPYPWMGWVFEAFVLTGALWLMAYFLQFNRLYLYAVLVGFGYMVTEFIHPYTGEPWNALIAYGLPGVLVIGFGVYMLLRFIDKYPLRSGPGPDAPGDANG